MAATFTEGSVESFIEQRLPSWLHKRGDELAWVDRLRALRKASLRQERAVQALRPVLAGIEPIDAFASSRLAGMLKSLDLQHVDMRASRVYTWLRPLLPRTGFAYSQREKIPVSAHSLLESALNNYDISDTRPSSLYRGVLKDAQDQVLGVGFLVFAGRCRALDIGGQYQQSLKHLLQPQGREAWVRQLFEEAQQAHLEVAVRQAYLKGELDEQSYLHMLPLISSPAVVASIDGAVAIRQLYLLGVAVHGLACVEVRDAPGGVVRSIILWVPNDPYWPVQRYLDWQALYDAIARRLFFRGYRRFFERFIAQADRGRFFSALARQAKGWTLEHQASLAGKHESIKTPLKTYLATSQIDKIFNDARVIAVPTADVDAKARSELMQDYATLGWSVLGIAGLFVPVLGEAMTALFAVQLAEQVYEGYQDWDHGDRQGAMDHLFGVAETLVVGALAAKGLTVAANVIKRSAFVEGLSLIRRNDGQLRLCHSSLKGYRLKPGSGELPAARLYADDQFYGVANGSDGRIIHPGKANAYAPAIEHNEGGGWRHELEQPWSWQGAGKLVRRFSERFSGMTDSEAEQLLQATGFTHAQVRQLHLQNMPAPARLLDSIERLHLHEQYASLASFELDALFRERQPLAGKEQRILQEHFSSLSLAAVREIYQQASGTEMTRLLAEKKLPLAMASRAKWYLRESRLDRACEGLRRYRAVNDDSQSLALGLIDTLAPWPEGVRFELRGATGEGPMLAERGKPGSASVHRVIRSGGRYRLEASDDDQDFMSLLFSCLSAGQKAGLRLPEQTLAAFEDKLADAAFRDRQQVARLIGITEPDTWRPPQRFGDGRIGYALSGRPGSSRQLIADDIHKIFTTLSDDELESYMLDLVTRRVGLWEHLATLREHFEGLKQALTAWQGQGGGILDNWRRRRVADAIRRSWRRKVVNVRNENVLYIDGEQVGQLPNLPTGVSFEHVQRLTLRGMALREVDEHFLRRFPNLVELDLQGNALTRMPEGLQHLSQLRVLNLSANGIVLDAAGDQALHSLVNLRELDISENPHLGRVPDVRNMRLLQRLRLSNAGIEELADSTPPSVLMDLRENRIMVRRQANERMRQQLRRALLHDNPVTETSGGAASLPVRSVERAGVHENLDYMHATVDEAVRTNWLGDLSAPLHDERKALWDALQSEPGAGGLFRFFADLATSRDFKRYPDSLRPRVWQLLDACSRHENLRLRLFEQANGPRGCDDRLLYSLRQFEVWTLAEQAILAVPAEQVEPALVGLARSLWRYDTVENLAAEHVGNLRKVEAAQAKMGLAIGAEDRIEVDEVETMLAYQVGLDALIGLPIPRDGMHYGGDANVSQLDLDLARAKVISLENDEVLIQSLADRPFWEAHAKDRYRSRFDAFYEDFAAKLQVADDELAAGNLNEAGYLARMNTLQDDYRTGERAALIESATDVYSRLKPLPQP